MGCALKLTSLKLTSATQLNSQLTTYCQALSSWTCFWVIFMLFCHLPFFFKINFKINKILSGVPSVLSNLLLGSGSKLIAKVSADFWCLLITFANYQFGHRSGPIEHQFWSRSEPLETLIVSLREFFENVSFEKCHQTTTKALKLHSMQRVKDLTLKAPIRQLSQFLKKIRYDISWESSANRQFSWNIMPYLLFLKKRQNLKLSSAANYRWCFKGY